MTRPITIGGTLDYAALTGRDVLVYGLGLDPDAPTYAQSARQLGAAAAEALERAGWHKVARVQVAGDRRTVYRREGSLW